MLFRRLSVFAGGSPVNFAGCLGRLASPNRRVPMHGLRPGLQSKCLAPVPLPQTGRALHVAAARSCRENPAGWSLACTGRLVLWLVLRQVCCSQTTSPRYLRGLLQPESTPAQKAPVSLGQHAQLLTGGQRQPHGGCSQHKSCHDNGNEQRNQHGAQSAFTADMLTH
jgi:hypothetical protein